MQWKDRFDTHDLETVLSLSLSYVGPSARHPCTGVDHVLLFFPGTSQSCLTNSISVWSHPDRPLSCILGRYHD